LELSTSNEPSIDAYPEVSHSRLDCISRSSIRGYIVIIDPAQ